MNNRSKVLQNCFTILVAILTVAVCVLPMGSLPIWNGERPDHRNQYELMAEAILDGRISFDYGDEYTLSQLKNPYDPNERTESGVYFHWDHAYYNGQYYMYFGIVPVFLAFLPYRILTGTALTTYRATQFFVACAIAGIFVLFRLLNRRFFKKMPYGVYLCLSAAFSVMSVWYAAAEPALYCTAITAAIALEIWSLYWFVRAVWDEQEENRQLLFAGIGAALGALVFGCRPPIALANILVLPMLAVFLRRRRMSFKLLGKLLLAASPYVLVAAALMTYNYVRFDDPFEFGQAYQLTVADQSQYSITLDAAMLARITKDTVRNFFEAGNRKDAFPYVAPGSVFFNFPLLLLCFGMFLPSVWKAMVREKLLPLGIGFFVTVLVITAVDIMWTPYILERYRMDIYFLMGIWCFTVIGFLYPAGRISRGVFSVGLAALSAVTVLAAYLFFAYRVGVYYPDKLKELSEAFLFAQYIPIP